MNIALLPYSYLDVDNLLNNFFAHSVFAFSTPTQFHAIERAFCLCNKENMFNASLCKDYSPVGNVIANRSWNLEFAWKLCIHLHFFRIFKCLCKFMFTFSIKRHIRNDMLLCLTQIPLSRFLLWWVENLTEVLRNFAPKAHTDSTRFNKKVIQQRISNRRIRPCFWKINWF